jgi:hypothetical protein
LSLDGDNTLITSEQSKLSPSLLMGFCEKDQQWYKFDKDTQPNTCPSCGNTPSSKVGFQVTTQRSFDPAAKKLTKTQLKKMGSIGA